MPINITAVRFDGPFEKIKERGTEQKVYEIVFGALSRVLNRLEELTDLIDVVRFEPSPHTGYSSKTEHNYGTFIQFSIFMNESSKYLFGEEYLKSRKLELRKLQTITFDLSFKDTNITEAEEKIYIKFSTKIRQVMEQHMSDVSSQMEDMRKKLPPQVL